MIILVLIVFADYVKKQLFWVQTSSTALLFADTLLLLLLFGELKLWREKGRKEEWYQQSYNCCFEFVKIALKKSHSTPLLKLYINKLQKAGIAHYPSAQSLP